jgi:hypothetical protein
MVSGLKNKDYEDWLKELGMNTLEERRHQSDMLQVFKIRWGGGGGPTNYEHKKVQNGSR